jgi:hypothetical protein
VSETGTTPAVNPPPWGPDYRLEAISLAVELWAGQAADEQTVLHTADEFYARLTLNRIVPPGVASEILATLGTITRQLETTMTALDSLTAADTALKTEVTTAIADWATALTNANGANDPAIQAVADDMSAQVSALQAADPSTPPVPPVTPTP